MCIDDRFSKPVVFYRGKIAVYRFIETVLEDYDEYVMSCLMQEIIN